MAKIIDKIAFWRSLGQLPGIGKWVAVGIALLAILLGGAWYVLEW